MLSAESTNTNHCYRDNLVPALKLMVTSTGKRWYFDKSIDGTRIKRSLGDINWISLADARDQANKLLQVLKDDGTLPSGAAIRVKAKSIKHKITYEDLFKTYVNNHLKVFRAKTTIYDAELGYKRYCQRFHNMDINEITACQIQEWVNATGERYGRETANKQFRFFRACLRWSAGQEIIELKKDPTKNIRLFKKDNRTRYIKPGDEFQALKKALDLNPGDSTDIIWLLLFTAARKGNILAMRWQNVDLGNRVWYIPKTKSGQPLAVMLTAAAMEILRRRQELSTGSLWVFPSDKTSDHIRDITRPWHKILKKAGLKDIHLHDLRHTAASMMGVAGASALTIQRALGHSSVRMTEKYTHLGSEHIRITMEQAQQLLLCDRAPQSPP